MERGGDHYTGSIIIFLALCLNCILTTTENNFLANVLNIILITNNEADDPSC